MNQGRGIPQLRNVRNETSLEVLDGRRGDPMDHAVRKRDIREVLAAVQALAAQSAQMQQALLHAQSRIDNEINDAEQSPGNGAVDDLILGAQNQIVRLRNETDQVRNQIIMLSQELRSEFDGISDGLRQEFQDADVILSQQIVDLDGQITIEASTRQSGDAILAGLITNVRTDVDGNTAAISDEAIARSSADSALAVQISTVSAKANQNESNISTETIARVDADAALAGQISTVNSRVGDAEAAIASEALTRANADSALSTRTSVVEAGIRSSNLIADGAFSTGDLEGWSSIPTTFSVIARGSLADAAVQNAPKPFILRINSDSVNRSAVVNDDIPVQPEEKFRAAISIARQGTGSAEIDIVLQFNAADGSTLASTVLDSITAVTSWQRFTMNAVAPAGAATLGIRLRRRSGGSARAFVSDVRVERVSMAVGAVDARVSDVIIAYTEADEALAGSITDLGASLTGPTGIVTGQGVLIDGLVTRVTDTEDGIEVLTASQTILSASVRGANLMPNGAFATGASGPGELPGWSDVPATFRIEARGGASNDASQNAPQPFYLRTDSDSINRSAIAAEVIPCNPGDQFRAALSIAAFGSGTASFDVILQFLDPNGTVVNNNFLNVTSSNTTWARVILPASGFVVAPAGAASLLLRLRRRADGPPRAYVTDIRVERVNIAQTEANAAIVNLQSVKVDGVGAVAAVNHAIRAEYADIEALAEATFFASATVDGILEGFVWSLGGENVLSLIRVDDGVTEPSVDVTINGNVKVTNLNISGDIQSDNYAESGGNPTAGFRLKRDTGQIKGVEIIDRNGLVAGAATDFLPATIPGIFTGVTAYRTIQTILSVLTGPTALDEMWSVAACGFFRRQPLSFDASEIINPQIWVQRRVKFDGVWSVFANVGTSTTNANGWIPVVFSENFAGNFEDVEYIIEARLSTLGAPDGATPDELVFRDFAINLQRNKR